MRKICIVKGCNRYIEYPKVFKMCLFHKDKDLEAMRKGIWDIYDYKGQK